VRLGFATFEQCNEENALLYCKSSNIQCDLKRKSNGEPNKLFWELPKKCYYGQEEANSFSIAEIPKDSFADCPNKSTINQSKKIFINFSLDQSSRL
jgi:hypothetical protein